MSPETAVIQEVLQRYSRDPSNLIMVLQDIQASLKYISKEAIDTVSEWLSVPRSQIYSVSSFYKAFSLEPRGKHQVDICLGTACHVRGARILVNHMSRELGIKPRETTPDKELTLNTVNCVGACAMGPVAVIDGEYYGEMTPLKLSKKVKQCCSGEGARAGSAAEPATAAAPAYEKIPARKLASVDELEQVRRELLAERPLETPCILVCAGTGCIANGSLNVARALERELEAASSDTQIRLMVKKTGCHGFCEQAPLVVFHPAGTCYTHVKPKDAAEIVEKTVVKNKVVRRLLASHPETGVQIEQVDHIPFYSNQHKNVLRHIGRIDPENIRDFFTHGGYGALAMALTKMKPDEVITEVERSGLRGCGGGGFPTGRKWRSCVNAPGDVRYLICNADEGDPGAFMDCSILEGNPHSVIEGMLISAYAIQAVEGYIYLRDEYPLAVKRFGRALEQAR